MRLPRLRFAEPEVERAFLAEYAALDRGRHLVVWCIAIVIVLTMGIADTGTSEQIRTLREARLFGSLPIVLVTLAVGLAPERVFQRWWQPVTAAACFGLNALISVAAWLMGRDGAFEDVTRLYGAEIMLLTVMTTYTGVSLRVGHAALAAIPATLVWLVMFVKTSPSPSILGRAAFLVASSHTLGVFAASQIERLRRLEFLRRHELAVERAKSEGSLKREISHQVAERSRELKEVLVRGDLVRDAARLSPGDRFDARYRVVRVLGEGGMGAVYEVERLTDGSRLAMKVMTGAISGNAAARFAREAEIGARLQHENLVSIADVGISNGTPFLVMDLIEGGSLEDERHKFGDPEWARPVLLQIARGLEVLHAAGVVHRDLKPGNVLLAAKSGAAKISDFGISALNEAEIDVNAQTLASTTPKRDALTGTGVLLGTPLYMAPEAAGGARAADKRADVFAFGILAHEMLGGHSPFTTPPVLLALASQPIPPAAELTDDRIDARLRALVASCLSIDPDRRPSIRELTDALN